MKTGTLLATLWLFALNGFGQQTRDLPTPRWNYFGMLLGGIVAGQSEANYCAQTIQGMQNGPWLLGIGAGIDNYVLPGFPVVAHGQWQYGKQRSKPFVYAQAGPHFPWAKNEWDDKILGSNRYDLKTGWLAESGIGYSMPLGKSLKLNSSLGYSVKQAKYDEAQIPWSSWIDAGWPISGSTPLTYYHNKLTMNRVVLKVGLQF